MDNKPLPLDKVLERIKFWGDEVEKINNLKFTETASKKAKVKQIKDTNGKLLTYWLNYKKKYYKNN